MPEIYFTIELPDGATRQCYSPSTVVRDYFAAGEELTVAEFLDRSRKAFGAASDRVRARHGFACGAAASQLAEIEHTTRAYPEGGAVKILNI